MKIAYDHILKFLEEKPDIQDISSKLFQLGHEHEIENSIFDMEFTPNRGDCLSVHGLVRDLNVFYQTNLNVPIYEGKIHSLDLNFINQAQNDCPRISFLNIEIKDDISSYKDYLENYFKNLNINKNNFFADVSNYLAYEMGQPTHCYDFSTIGNDITLKQNKITDKFKTLLGSTINLKGSDLVFSSNKEIINLSGIIGSMKTACTSKTTNALIECAYFKPESIIGKALKYNLHSDASHKFERGTDPKCHERALRRFIQIVRDHTEIIKLELHTYDNHNLKDIELDFDHKKVNNILGLSVNENDYKDSLHKLGFKIDEVIKVPSYRSDISHQNDLAEELARVIGYDNIPANSINIFRKLNQLNHSEEDKIRTFLTERGFTEVINLPFCNINNIHAIKVDNPLDTNRKYFRTNLTDSLIDNAIYNEKRQKDSIKFFEIADIYTFNKSLKREKRLALIISGRRGQNYTEFSKKLDIKYLKELFQEINFDVEKSISNIDRSKLDSKIKIPIYAVELKVDSLLGKINNFVPRATSLDNFIKYKPISEFPSSYRDLSFSIKDASMISQVIHVLSVVESIIIKNSFMFDFFENKKINEIKIGYRFIFQSHTNTLKDAEINKEIKRITDSVLAIDSVSLPGS